VASNRAALAANWRKRRQVFAVPHPDKTARKRDIYSAFQFEDRKPIKALQEVIEAFGGRKAPWKLALWFTSNNGLLPDGARPVDLLASDPQAVIAAACTTTGPFVGLDADCAIFETVFHDVTLAAPDKFVDLGDFVQRGHGEFVTSQDLNLVNRTSEGLHRLKVPKEELMASPTRDDPDTALWAQEVHGSYRGNGRVGGAVRPKAATASSHKSEARYTKPPLWRRLTVHRNARGKLHTCKQPRRAKAVNTA
jgi:hypothetical protein